MAEARFEPNMRGYRELRGSPMLYPGLEPIARRIESRWKAAAASHRRTGAYQQSIHLERSRSHDRVRVRVVADDRVAAILEARYHIGGRAVG